MIEPFWREPTNASLKLEFHARMWSRVDYVDSEHYTVRC